MSQPRLAFLLIEFENRYLRKSFQALKTGTNVPPEADRLCTTPLKKLCILSEARSSVMSGPLMGFKQPLPQMVVFDYNEFEILDY